MFEAFARDWISIDKMESCMGNFGTNPRKIFDFKRRSIFSGPLSMNINDSMENSGYNLLLTLNFFGNEMRWVAKKINHFKYYIKPRGSI